VISVRPEGIRRNSDGSWSVCGHRDGYRYDCPIGSRLPHKVNPWRHAYARRKHFERAADAWWNLAGRMCNEDLAWAETVMDCFERREAVEHMADRWVGARDNAHWGCA
jgi:hypothetical protein